ncbi:hypothetical protein FEM48_Zijuj12G0150400 [Ziziphus jujuba var. spinosa]|nr:hypothetical protein FEM48_Zijuj12G0150400 [Ziziphus jujuba var. spinosa]
MGFVFSNYSCKIVQILVYGIVALNCFSAFVTHAQLLPRDEVQTLEAISKALKLETIWNVSDTSCSRNEGFNFTKGVGNGTGSIISNVTCDCSFEKGTLCRIKTIMLKGLNLTGNLPAEFGNLAYLEELNLARNNISGSITPNLSRAPLRFL